MYSAAELHGEKIHVVLRHAFSTIVKKQKIEKETTAISDHVNTLRVCKFWSKLTHYLNSN
jgi:hypothetical protein